MRRWLACLLGALLPVCACAEDDGTLGMGYVETPDARIVWFEPLDYLVPHTIRTFSNALAWQKRWFGWLPSEPVTIVLSDFADYGQAAATAIPRNRLRFDVAPLLLAFETYPASERLYAQVNHEIVHVAQGDVANEDDRRYRRFFLGKVAAEPEHPESLLYSFLTVPRFNVPRWYLEGSAVFVETWMAGGLGRAQGGFDEMVFRAMVRDGASFYDPLGLESRGVRSDFQMSANAYLYGTRFITWLAYEHSPEKVLQWIRRDEDSRRHYWDQFLHVFGVPLERAWQDWIRFEQAFQQANLAEIRRHPVTPHRKLVDRALGNISRIHYDEATGVLYGGFRIPGFVDHIGALDTGTGTLRRITDIRKATFYRVASFAFDAERGTIFYSQDNHQFRDLMAVDVKTGATRMLLQDARIGEFAFNPADRSLIGVRHSAGHAVLVSIPYPYTEWKPLHLFPYGVVPYDLDVSPDGRLLSASVAEVNGDQYLRVWEVARVAEGNLKPLSEFRFGQSVPESFVFSPDGRYLYGSSYYTGVSNIFRYEVATGEVEAVSNTDADFFRPFPLKDGRLVVLTYTAEGFVPAIIEPVVVKDASAIRFLGNEVATKHPVVTTWQVDPPSRIDDEKMVVRSGAYKAAGHVALNNAFPVLQGYKDAIALGYHFNFADPLGFATLDITAAWSVYNEASREERPHIEVKGRFLEWWGSVSWNRSDFYDLFGPTKRGRKGLALKGGYEHYLIYDDPRKLQFVAEAAFYDKIDRLPYAQNIEAGFERLSEMQVGLKYDHVLRSLGAADDDKGVRASAFAGVQHVTGHTPWYVYGNLDYGWDLPLPNSSVWLRTAGGYVSGDPDVSISNFYLGAFGNNYVDSGDIKRYREWFAYPGFGINEISGQSFVRPMVEWNITPVVFESLGTPVFHLAWLRPALFASALWTDVEDSARRRDYANVGGQVDLRFSVLHWHTMTLSFGYAVGFREGRRAGDEFMLSLKIM